MPAKPAGLEPERLTMAPAIKTLRRLRFEREQRAAASERNKALLAERRERKALRAAHRSLVLGALERGGDTFGKIRKALKELAGAFARQAERARYEALVLGAADLTDNEIRAALRGLIRTGRIEKASARRYVVKGD